MLDWNIGLSIAEEIYEETHEPTNFWPKECFKKASYSKWAAKEVVDLIKLNPNKNPSILINTFKQRILHYSTLNPNTHDMFLIVYQVADSVLDTIQAAL